MKHTEKLYYQDSYIQNFQAKVLMIEDITREKQSKQLAVDEILQYRMLLDRTAFFPESGGQYADTGTIAGYQVADVQEQDGFIFHYINAEQAITDITTGDKVEAKIDWSIRYMKMQQHTGEHILSGLVMKHLQIRNVGFHLGSEVSTLDFAQEIDDNQLRLIETMANQVVYANLPVEESWPSTQEAELIPYRSKIEIGQDLRLITIPEVDICACCAPHVRRTGEVGVIRIMDSIRYKGGVRITMLCATKVIEDHRVKAEIIQNLSVMFSAPQDLIYKQVQLLKEESQDQKRKIYELQQDILRYKVAALEEQEVYILFEADLQGNTPRDLANLLLERNCEYCVIFTQAEENQWRYIMGSKKIDVRPIGQHVNQKFQGKGGGSRDMVQGMIQAPQEEIAYFMKGMNYS